MGGKFEDVLMKIDVNEYLKQREYEQKTKAEIDTKLEEIEKENESNAEQIKLFKKYQCVIEATQNIWSSITDHLMKPEQSSFCRIIAGFVNLFDNGPEDRLSLFNNNLSQLDVISNAAWNQCLNGLKEITLEKINGFNPNEIESFDVAFIDKLLNG